MIKSAVTFIFLMPIFSQEMLNWDLLKNVNVKESYESFKKLNVYLPQFGKEIQKFHQKKVQIMGYLIPLNVERNEYALSAHPFYSCFFCGKSGVESVIRLNLKVKQHYDIDSFVMVSGILMLNDKNPEDLIYILNEGQVEIL